MLGLAAATVGLPLIDSISLEAQAARRAAPSPDDWLKDVKGTHRCLFDFPQHRNGVPLLHMLNYLNTYAEAYKAAPGTAGAVGTFYGIGAQSSIALAFDDAAWAKYGLSDYLGLKDEAGKPYARNVFYRPTTGDAHLLGQAMQLPAMPGLAGAVPALGIESLQKMGAKFLMCNNAFGAWCMELEARGKGKMADLDADLRKHLLPGVTIVPAMVIAIEKAQTAGIRYNRQ
jgi:intracellular sulfur oxidation DsrE/DsrF family protein